MAQLNTNSRLLTIVLNRIAFAPARKPYRIGLLFTQMNGDFSAVSVTARSSKLRCTDL